MTVIVISLFIYISRMKNYSLFVKFYRIYRINIYYYIPITDTNKILLTDSYQREKRLLLDENVQLRKEKDIIERESNRKDSQIMQVSRELDKVASALRTAETNLQLTQNQVSS